MGVQQKSITALQRQSLDDIPGLCPVKRTWLPRYIRMSARLRGCCMRRPALYICYNNFSVFKLKASSPPSSTDTDSSSQSHTRLSNCFSR
ncbi:hypothetical protein D0866_05477 [Hortaea werneckii]|uniref:Uncharacterized protein n=1 Tax=Hortaea werneckii TaxID=91943 RepID=A0A3M7B355_HORWE|nr:hypothetical protein D0866_05477 [Hortaea werneckii]